MTNQKVIAATAVFGAILAGIASPVFADKMNLVLNWVPGGDHAPIFWAKEQGWYADAGIELEIEHGTGSGGAVKKVGVGRNQVGIADLPTVLSAIGKGSDVVAVMNIYANSPYTIYWLKSSGISGFDDLKGKTIGNPPFDAARQMWPAIAKILEIAPDDVSFVNVKPNAKVAALKSGSIDATTNFYNAHFVFERIFGDDLGFVTLKELGFNPYGNSIIANRTWAEENEDTLKKFVSITQRAYATCVETPQPCIETLASAGSQKVDDVAANWALVVELMTSPSSVEGAIGYFDPERMRADYQAVQQSFEGFAAYDIETAYDNKYLDMSLKMPSGQ